MNTPTTEWVKCIHLVKHQHKSGQTFIFVGSPEWNSGWTLSFKQLTQYYDGGWSSGLITAKDALPKSYIPWPTVKDNLLELYNLVICAQALCEVSKLYARSCKSDTKLDSEWECINYVLLPKLFNKVQSLVKQSEDVSINS